MDKLKLLVKMRMVCILFKWQQTHQGSHFFSAADVCVTVHPCYETIALKKKKIKWVNRVRHNSQEHERKRDHNSSQKKLLFIKDNAVRPIMINVEYLEFCSKTISVDEFLSWETSRISWKPLNLILQLQDLLNKGSESNVSIVLLNTQQPLMHFILMLSLSLQVTFGESNLLCCS